jgi:uncharacterized protein YkwD
VSKRGASIGMAVVVLLATGIFAPWPFPRSRPVAALAAGSCSNARTGLALDSEEQDVLTRINNYRSLSGLAPLSISPTLMASAIWKSTDLGANAYFAHDDLSRSWGQRIADCGYAATPNIAENLAAGNSDGASTFLQWQTSAGHNANLLSPSMRAVGIARAYTAGSPYSWYWTADFGAVLDTSPMPAAPATVSSAAPPRPPASPTPAPASIGPAPSPNRLPLGLGATAVVTGTGDCLRVPNMPSISASDARCLPDGAAMVVSDGPKVADGYTWWKLGVLGWAVDLYLSALP